MTTFLIEPIEGPRCGETHSPWRCTLPAGHAGEHQTIIARKIMAHWPQEKPNADAKL